MLKRRLLCSSNGRVVANVTCSVPSLVLLHALLFLCMMHPRTTNTTVTDATVSQHFIFFRTVFYGVCVFPSKTNTRPNPFCVKTHQHFATEHHPHILIPSISFKSSTAHEQHHGFITYTTQFRPNRHRNTFWSKGKEIENITPLMFRQSNIKKSTNAPPPPRPPRNASPQDEPLQLLNTSKPLKSFKVSFTGLKIDERVGDNSFYVPGKYGSGLALICKANALYFDYVECRFHDDSGARRRV